MSNDLVLPEGAECRRCNPALGTIDRELVRHNRIRGPIMLLGVPGKGRRRRTQLGPLHRDRKTGDFRIVPVIKKAQWDPGKLHLEVPEYDEVDERRFRRALHHMAFNYLARKFGVPFALDPRFDPVRTYIRAPTRLAAWKYAQTMLPDDKPRRQLRLSVMEMAPGLTVRFESYLDDFYVDCLNSGELHAWAAEKLPSGTGLL